MARQRTIKYPPKRGKLTKHQVKRAVEKVVRERLKRETEEAAVKETIKALKPKTSSQTA